jgi:hypothetical protein
MTTETLAPTPATLEEILSLRRRLPEWLTLFAYWALLVYEIPRHEPWADEAQAWQLARSVPLSQLFSRYLRYEGSPGLWHLLIAFLGKLHVTYAGFHWFSGAVALLGISLLIFLAPFPRSIRLTLPFTFYLAFQYAVVARSYVLVPLLLFGVALVWRHRNPILLALLLGLLGNLALHVLAISVGFALVYFLEIWLGYRERPDTRKLFIAASLLIILYGFAIWTVLPLPSDIVIPSQTHREPFDRVKAWLIIATLSLCIGVVQPVIFAVPLWIMFIVRFARTQRAFYLLPLATFALFSGYYINFWQAGLVIPTTITLCWIAWPYIRQPKTWSALTIGIACFISMQFVWTYFANLQHPYSSGPETARFLAPYVAAGETIALTSIKLDAINAYHSMATYPYFDLPIFVNQPRPFWLWSNQEHTFQQFKEAMDKKPRIVLVDFHGQKDFDPSRDLVGPQIGLLQENGYRLTHTFCARQPQGFDFQEQICDLIFERLANSHPTRLR